MESITEMLLNFDLSSVDTSGNSHLILMETVMGA